MQPTCDRCHERPPRPRPGPLSPRCVLRAVLCVLCAVCCVLCIVCCVLCIVCCVLCAVCCVLCVVCCVLCCVLCVVCCARVLLIACLPACLSVCLPACLPVCLPACLSVWFGELLVHVPLIAYSHLPFMLPSTADYRIPLQEATSTQSVTTATMPSHLHTSKPSTTLHRYRAFDTPPPHTHTPVTTASSANCVLF